MKLIHCADIHLDSKMESNLNRKQASQRRAEVRETFLRLIQYAKDNDFSVMLIAGDMFDEKRCGATTLEEVLDAVRNAPDIDFLYLKGNHDDVDLFSAFELPDNFKRFSESWTTYQYGDVAISGVEITRSNYKTIYSDYAPVEGAVNIAMLHGGLSYEPGVDQVCLSALEGSAIDYLALGHLHYYQEGMIGTSDKFWCYPGCLEGRGFDECGPKGFVEVSIDDGRIRRRFVPFAQRALYEIPVDITNCATFPEIKSAVSQQLDGIPENALVKIVLSGQYEPETNKDLDALRTAFEHRFFFVKVVDESTLRIDPEAYKNDVSLRGEFVRLVFADTELNEEDREYILNCGLRAFAGEKVAE